jgi:hypothetical protein
MTTEFLDINPILIPGFVASMMAHVSNSLSVDFEPAERTIEMLIQHAGFDLNRPSAVQRMPSTLTIRSAQDMIGAMILKRLWGDYVEVTSPVDLTQYSFGLVLMATVLRLFPRNFLAEPDRIIMNNWVYLYIIKPLFLSRVKNPIKVDKHQARIGLIDYLEMALENKLIPDDVRAFWDVNLGYSESGIYEPIDIELHAKLWEDNPSDIRMWPFTGSWINERFQDIPAFDRFRAYADFMATSRTADRLNGARDHMTTYRRMLTLVSQRQEAYVSMMYVVDRVTEALARGMPTKPQTIYNADVQHPGAGRFVLERAAPLSAFFLLKFDGIQAAPLTKAPAQAGMNINEWTNTFIQSYHWVRQNTTAERWRKSERMVEVKKMTDAFASDPIMSYVYNMLEDPVFKATIRVPPLSATDGLLTEKLIATKALITEHPDWFGYQPEFYIMPIMTTELVNPDTMFTHSWEYTGQDTYTLKEGDLPARLYSGITTLVDSVELRGRALKIEVPVNFSIEQTLVRPEQNPDSILSVNMQGPTPYNLSPLKWWYTLKDDVYDTKRTLAPMRLPPRVVIARPPNISEHAIGWFTNLKTFIRSRKDAWKYYNFSDFPVRILQATPSY